MSDWDAFPVVDAQDDWSAFPVIAPPQPILPKPKESSWLENIPYVGKAANAIGDAALGVGTSMLAAPISGYAGIAGALMPGPEGQGAAWQKRVAEALTYQPETKFGKGVEDVLGYPGEKLHQGAQYVGNKVEDYTGSPLAATAAQTGIESLPMFLPYGLKKAFPEAGIEGSQVARDALQASRAQKDAIYQRAMDSGFSLPPSEVNPTFISNRLEGLAGPSNMKKAMAAANDPLAADKIRADFNLPNDAPLNPETFAAVREQMAAKYEAVKNTGETPPSFEYRKKLNDMAIQLQDDYRNQPSPPTLDAIDRLDGTTFDARAAITDIREFRSDARKFFRNGDGSLGHQYQVLADIVEKELGEHLKRSGAPPDLLAEYQDARQQIAKSYTMEKLVTPAGEPDAVGLANALKRGVPLEGGMAEVANLGAVPTASKIPSRTGGLLPNIGDTALGWAASHLPGGTAAKMMFGLAGSMTRPLAAKFMAGPYQKFLETPDYGPSMGNRMMSAVQEPAVGMAESAWGIESEDEKRRKMLAQILGGY